MTLSYGKQQLKAIELERTGKISQYKTRRELGEATGCLNPHKTIYFWVRNGFATETLRGFNKITHEPEYEYHVNYSEKRIPKYISKRVSVSTKPYIPETQNRAIEKQEAQKDEVKNNTFEIEINNNIKIRLPAKLDVIKAVMEAIRYEDKTTAK